MNALHRGSDFVRLHVDESFRDFAEGYTGSLHHLDVVVQNKWGIKTNLQTIMYEGS